MLQACKQSCFAVVYKSQRNAWADAAIFTDWFNCHFIPLVKKQLIQRGLTPKALLLLDNAPAHPDCSVLVSQDKAIKAMGLPPNTTALIQPMDQGVLEALKRRYRRPILQRLLCKTKQANQSLKASKASTSKMWCT